MINRLQVLILVLGFTNAVAAAALGYEASDFKLSGLWRFLTVVYVGGCGFLLMNIRSLRDADEKPVNLDSVTHREPQHEDVGSSYVQPEVWKPK